MSDLDSYLQRCYDLLLQQETPGRAQDDECCACARLVEHDTSHSFTQ